MSSAALPTGKDLLLSRSFWGAVVLLVAVALKAAGHEFDPEQATDRLLQFLENALPIAGFLLSFFGTLFRKSPIASVGGLRVGKLFGFLALLGLSSVAQAQSLECPDPRLAVDLPAEIRTWYRNPDGSCVQCSIGMCGVDQNVPAAATLLWDTEYGRKERGGSGPSRVAEYCQRRGIRAYNVTGENTWDWMRWACSTGRGAAIGAGGAHFQTLMGYDPRTSTWYVCNNNSPQKIDAYDEQGFRRLHLASGQWVVVLDYPPHPARPQYVRWW